MAYGTTAGATALVPTLTISTNSKPTTAQVTAWLAEADAIIDRTVAGAGYAIPIASGTTLYTELAGLSNLYAAAYVLRAVGVDTATGVEEDRSEIWLRSFHDRLQSLSASDLTALGAAANGTGTAVQRRRRIRTLQLRRVDGYSATYEASETGYEYTSD